MGSRRSTWFWQPSGSRTFIPNMPSAQSCLCPPPPRTPPPPPPLHHYSLLVHYPLESSLTPPPRRHQDGLGNPGELDGPGQVHPTTYNTPTLSDAHTAKPLPRAGQGCSTWATEGPSVQGCWIPLMHPGRVQPQPESLHVCQPTGWAVSAQVGSEA